MSIGRLRLAWELVWKGVWNSALDNKDHNSFFTHIHPSLAAAHKMHSTAWKMHRFQISGWRPKWNARGAFDLYALYLFIEPFLTPPKRDVKSRLLGNNLLFQLFLNEMNPQFIEKSFDRKASSDSVANKQSSFVAKNNKENSMNTKYFNGRASLHLQ